MEPERAEQMRKLAEGVSDLVARASMLQIVDQYERLAVRAEQRLRDQKPAAWWPRSSTRMARR